MFRDLRAIHKSRIHHMVEAGGFCFNTPSAPMPTLTVTNQQTGQSSQVPAPANCVRVCPPSKDYTAPGQFVVNDLNSMEAISQPLYDYLAYPQAGQLTFTFFQVPQGGTKTEVSTNMELGGQLPAPQKFLISGIAVSFLAGMPPIAGPQADTSISNVNDYYAVMNNLAGVNAVAKVKIGSKNYLTLAPLMALPERSHINGVMAACTDLTTGAATQTLGSLGYSDGDVFKPVPLLIEAGQNFNATVTFPSLVALPSANTHSQLGFVLYGTLYRAPQ